MAHKEIDQNKVNEMRDLLFLELSLKENNGLVGSQFGGNKAQLLFLLSKKVEFILGSEEQEKPIKIAEDEENFSFTFCPKKRNLDFSLIRHVRNELNSFCEQKNLTPITTEQISDPVFLKSQTIDPSNQSKIDLMLESFRILKEFRKKLDEQKDERNCPVLTEEEKKLFSKLPQADSFITLLTFREMVGIDNLFRFKLDIHKLIVPIFTGPNRISRLFPKENFNKFKN